MNKKFLLTVAIPTYSRSKILAQRLEELSKEKTKDFAILVADDASIDDTEQVVKEYQKKMKNLFYLKHKKNVGYSRNVSSLYEHAPSEYIWFLCDDDSVLPNSIEKITQAIRKYHPTLAIFNAIWINPFGQTSTAGVERDRMYNGIDQIKDYHVLMRTTFLSILVFKKICSLKELTEAQIENNVFFQLTLALYLLSENFRLVEVAAPITQRNVGYKYGEFLKFNIVDHLKAIHAVNHKFDNGKFITWSKKQIPNVFMLYLCQKLGIYIFTGKPTKETRDYTKKFYGLYSYLIFMFPFFSFVIPTYMLKFVYFVRLTTIFGYRRAWQVYNENTGRALRDDRKTTFLSYR